MKPILWLAVGLAAVVGLSRTAPSGPTGPVTDADIERLAGQGFREGIREPGELAVYVASALYPSEEWPPLFSATVDQEERYARIWVIVTDVLGRIR